MTDPLENKGEISFTSTLDHGVLPRHPFYPDAPREAAGIPLIVGNTHDETALWIGDLLKRGDTTWDNLPGRIAANSTKDMAPAYLVRRYREIYPERTPGQILLAATTAGRSWPGHLIQAEERAKIGAPAWMYQLDFPAPEAGGVLGAFHTLDIPLVFDNTGQPGARTGNGPDARALAGRMADAFIAFARSGDPTTGGLPRWDRYTLDRRPTMIFDRVTRMEGDPRREERLLFAAAPYIKPGG
jgi:para-nitrobenzyl esterase